MTSSLKIISFEEIYSKAFYQLNIEWLETFFYVENFDREVLSNPNKYIIEKVCLKHIYAYDGVRRVLGLRREPVVSVKNPTLIPTSH